MLNSYQRGIHMTARETYQVIEALTPLLTEDEWKSLLYDLDESLGRSFICRFVCFIAKLKSNEIVKVWPLSKEKLEEVLNYNSGKGYLCQEDINSLLHSCL